MIYHLVNSIIVSISYLFVPQIIFYSFLGRKSTAAIISRESQRTQACAVPSTRRRLWGLRALSQFPKEVQQDVFSPHWKGRRSMRNLCRACRDLQLKRKSTQRSNTWYYQSLLKIVLNHFWATESQYLWSGWPEERTSTCVGSPF